MRIISLEIDGYGVWTGLRVEGFDDGLNVLYGPNEAGKTTLLQFVRSVLYGFSPQRRRYLPPFHGGRPGGTIELVTVNGQFQVARHNGEPDTSVSGAGHSEQLVLTAADGTRQGEHFLKVLMSNVDEAIFNNVFAVGLREVQELGTLGDTEAAAMLYNLTAGLDRVSLLEVTRELETSRNRILDRDGRPCQVTQLMAQRQQVQAEIEELATAARRYGHLVAEQSQIEREAVRLEEEQRETDNRARVVELAIGVHDRWQQRLGIDDQLAALGTPYSISDGVVERFDAVQAGLQKHQKRLESLNHEHTEVRQEAAKLAINELLDRQTARIEALQEQQSWLTNLQNQVAELEKEVDQLQSGLAAEQKQLGLSDPARPGKLPELSARVLAKLHTPARAQHHSRQRVDEARQAVAAADAAVEALSPQIDGALAGRSDHDLSVLMDRAGNLVAQLRRRLQADERLGQLTRYQGELEEQSRQLLQRQLLPVWVLASLGGVFALGVMLLLSGLLLSSLTGPLGWTLSVLGLAGTGAAALGKVTLERSNGRQLEACQKQMGMLQSQLQQAQQERDTLDGQLPPGGGSLASRLATAEKDLAALEELVPLDTRRNAARQDAESARRRLSQAEEESASARRRWRDALGTAQLPSNFTLKQVRQLARSCDDMAQATRRLNHRRKELELRKVELDRLVGRIAQVAADAGVPLEGNQPLEHLRLLAAAVARQQAMMARRAELRSQLRQIVRQQARHKEATSRLKHRRRALLLETGADSEHDFRQRALNAARAAALRTERATLDREITATLAGHCSEDVVRELLERAADKDKRSHNDSKSSNRHAPRDAAPHTEREEYFGEHDSSLLADPKGLEALRDRLRDRSALLQKDLQQRFERRGQLREQLKGLIADRQLAYKQLELATIEKRLEEAFYRWQVLAVTCRTLESIRTTYEKERQPETLREASLYLEPMTQGRYCRVWTPLGENVLRVDDAEGRSLPVEVLSRGTREQLFLCLRLALAASYARHGSALPLVLDDVLVNFDAVRAKAAATVLRDFAATGHQVLVFTCHEHILRLFQSLKVPVGQLPDNAETEHAPVRLQLPAVKLPKRVRKPAEPPHKPAGKAKAIEEVVDDEAIEEPFEEVVEDEAVEDLIEESPAEVIAEDIVSSEPFQQHIDVSPDPPAAKKAVRRPRRSGSKRRGTFDADYFDPHNGDGEEAADEVDFAQYDDES
jgi:uncharacterized protein YhaN